VGSQPCVELLSLVRQIDGSSSAQTPTRFERGPQLVIAYVPTNSIEQRSSTVVSQPINQ
jgi:hypothetical protein